MSTVSPFDRWKIVKLLPVFRKLEPYGKQRIRVRLWQSPLTGSCFYERNKILGDPPMTPRDAAAYARNSKCRLHYNEESAYTEFRQWLVGLGKGDLIFREFCDESILDEGETNQW